MKQRLGPKKHARCEKISGHKYTVCWTRGGWPHGEAQCILAERLPLNGLPTSGLKLRFAQDSDLVNYKTFRWRPDVREGVEVTCGWFGKTLLDLAKNTPKNLAEVIEALEARNPLLQELPYKEPK